MDCREFQERWAEAVESRDDAALEMLRAHLTACGGTECVRLWQDHQILSHAVRNWKVPAVSAGVAQRALAELELGRPLPSRLIQSDSMGSTHGRSRTNTVAASCVAALVLCLIWFAGRMNRDDVPSRTVAQSAGERTEVVDPGPAETPTPQAQEAAALREVGESYVALAQKTTGFATDLAFLVVPGGYEEETPEGADDGAWVDRIEERFEPVRSGVSGKLGEWFGGPAT
jgi:hypothetical protein